MSRNRAILKKMSLALALLIALGPVLQRTGAPARAAGVRSPASTSTTQLTGSVAQSDGDFDWQSERARASLQTAFDALTRQAVSTTGLRVASMQSQLDPASLASAGAHVTGQGNWTVQALDSKGAQLAMTGTLSFMLDAQFSSNPAVTTSSASVLQASSELSGTLKGADTELTLLASVASTRDAANASVAQQQGHMDTAFTRSGTTSKVKVDSSGTTRTLAYNVTRSETHTRTDRDGTSGDATQVVTVRAVGRGESELWVHSTGNTGTAGAQADTLDQHYFQRVEGGALAQYMDRFDLNAGGIAYSLKAPAQVTGSLNGDAGYDFVLADPSGKEIHYTANMKPQSAVPSRMSGLYSPEPAPATSSLAGSNASILASTLDGPCGSAGAFGIGFGAGVAIGAVLALAFLEFGSILVLVAVTTGEVAFLEGALLAGIGFIGGVGAGCNGDPYFVDPGLHTLPAVLSGAAASPPSSAPIQITRSTGGLISPTLEITSTISAAAPVTAPVVSSISSQTYRDNPQTFVGGALPEGATAIGAWQWDDTPAHAYGAIPSHTQALSKGSQMHYFIHASSPLTLTADDNIVQYVYLDPQNPPTELYMQFYTGDGDGEHRVYWGEDKVQTGGARGTASLYPMGALPEAGGWVRLQVPVDKVALDSKAINGVLYGTYGGQTWWGPTTNSSRLTDNAPDAMPVNTEPAQPAYLPGAQIGYKLAQTAPVTIEIRDTSGTAVRTLLKDQSQAAGYRVAVWDGKNDQGATVEDKPYTARISAGGQSVETGVTISPFVANLLSPSAYGLVRGQDVPVLGEAYGEKFQSYTLQYGEGANPTTWVTITNSLSPSALPNANALNHAGNLANWNVGIDEFKPWTQPGLNGLYTLRLLVQGTDGREAVDSLPVLAGKLAHTAEGGEIASADGNAKLDIPPFGTFSSFSLMAIAPVTDTVTGDWRASLPAGMTPAGAMYEAFPPDELFRRPATLTMSYDKSMPADKVGLLIGDGTPAGWRYLGGVADPQTGLVQASIVGLTGLGKHAFLAPFLAGDAGFGPAIPTPEGMRLTLDPAAAAPSVTTDANTGYYSDLESGPGQWEALDRFGTQISRVTGADAGLADGNSAVKVARKAGGARLLNVLSTPIDAAKYPIVEFDYNMPPGYAPNLLVKSNGTWWQARMGNAGSASRTIAGQYFVTVPAPELTADGTWRHYQLDLLALLRSNRPDATSFQVDDIAFGQVDSLAYMQYAPVDSGEVGDAYYLDNFALVKPTNSPSFNLSFVPPQGVAFNAYSYALDRTADTTPAETAQGTTPAAKVDLPGDATDGQWYLHVRGQKADGTWSATTHFPLLVDRQAPTVGRADPPPGGAGAPTLITIPLPETNGVDLPSVRIRLGTNSYSMTPGNSGLRYVPETQSLQVFFNGLDPRPTAFTDGQKVEVSVDAVADYAGNALAAPVTWSFTVDKPAVANQPAFHQLTAQGGEQPALSPDGTTLAFVSGRSGTPIVWLMSATDYTEQSGSAHALLGTTDKAHEGYPAWSPDGTKLAYISDSGGTQQLWIASPDGSGATALTTGDGGAASPAWMVDGKNLVFVRDGNLWQVASDGTGLRSLTDDPDKPMRTVSAQPNGGLLAVGYKLYQETIKLYNPTTNEMTALTEGGTESEPAWLDSDTILYTSALTGTQSAVMQLEVSGSVANVLQGSGIAGTADLQPTAANPASGGQQIALVSTRGGDRNVWVRQDLQISRLLVVPYSGAPAGEPLTVQYTLPDTSTVSLQVLDSNGTQVRPLVDGAAQQAGAQEVVWDSKDASGNVVAPGDYVVALSAKVQSGDTLTRRTSARVLDPTSIGTLSLEIDQWAGKPLTTQLYSLQTVVYAQGNTTQPAATSGYYDYQPSFKLPEGRYDVQVAYGGTRTLLRGVGVQGSQTTTQTVNLQLGQLDVSVFTSPGQPATGNPYVRVSRSGDTANTVVQTAYDPVSSFILPPGKYDLQVEYQGVTKRAYGVLVRAGQATAQDIDLGSGLISLSVYEQDGQLAESGTGRLEVDAYRVGDHTENVTYDYNNPAQLRVPAGSYDLRISYGTVAKGFESGNVAGGSITMWLNNVQVDQGQTLTRDYNMRLTPVALKMEESPGKLAITSTANLSKVQFTVYPKDSLTASVGSSYTNTLHLQLPEGDYVVIADYAGTQLRQSGPIGGTISVKYGQSVDKTIDLGLGHFLVTVHDAAGQLLNPEEVYATAYPAGKTDNAFANTYRSNPLDLPVRGGVSYDIQLHQYSSGKNLVLAGKQLSEGETVPLDVNIADFK